MPPLRAAVDVAPGLILRPCSFDTFMAGPVGEITLNQIRPDDDHGANITQNSKNWKCSKRDPDGAERNPGRHRGLTPIRDSARLHRGYGLSVVTAGLDPAVHAGAGRAFGVAPWIAGSSPAMTKYQTPLCPALCRSRLLRQRIFVSEIRF